VSCAFLKQFSLYSSRRADADSFSKTCDSTYPNMCQFARAEICFMVFCHSVIRKSEESYFLGLDEFLDLVMKANFVPLGVYIKSGTLFACRIIVPRQLSLA